MPERRAEPAAGAWIHLAAVPWAKAQGFNHCLVVALQMWQHRNVSCSASNTPCTCCHKPRQTTKHLCSQSWHIACTSLAL